MKAVFTLVWFWKFFNLLLLANHWSQPVIGSMGCSFSCTAMVSLYNAVTDSTLLGILQFMEKFGTKSSNRKKIPHTGDTDLKYFEKLWKTAIKKEKYEKYAPLPQGGREDWPMRGLETDHVISGPMKGLKKHMLRGHLTYINKDGHGTY